MNLSTVSTSTSAQHGANDFALGPTFEMTMVRIWCATVLALSALLSACSNDDASSNRKNFSHRAVASVAEASRLSNGFSDNDRGLYARALQHVRNAHQRLGSFTIAQLLTDERYREDARNAARAALDREIAAEKRAAEKSREAAENSKANANLRSVLELTNHTMGERVFDSGAITDGQCGVVVDTDKYNSSSSQDQSEMNHLVIEACAGSYSLIGGPQRSLPLDGLPVTIYDLAGNRIYSDTAVKAGS